MAINIIRYEDLGQADFGWLKARYHFSFGRYYNPARMGFGDLVVINDDIVAPGRGFDPHPHDNMEIITYVRQGALSHKDSLGHEGRTDAGDVQVMSAGSGIRHAEYNDGDEPISLYQIWVKPHTEDVQPRWDSASFPKDPVKDTLPLFVSGREKYKKDKNVLYINANAALYAGRIAARQSVKQDLNNMGYLLVSAGEVSLDNETLGKGDAAEISGEQNVEMTAGAKGAEVIFIDLF